MAKQTETTKKPPVAATHSLNPVGYSSNQVVTDESGRVVDASRALDDLMTGDHFSAHPAMGKRKKSRTSVFAQIQKISETPPGKICFYCHHPYRGTLDEHLCDQHPESKTFQCPICLDAYRRDFLEKHIRTAHPPKPVKTALTSQKGGGAKRRK